ncbi:MAG: hypothetical protein DWQ40_03370 [Actinobacteria bacterium]|nr:MAG: hypothetical protein DWQ40_03370 [Actinomycetota bacterium]
MIPPPAAPAAAAAAAAAAVPVPRIAATFGPRMMPAPARSALATPKAAPPTSPPQAPFLASIAGPSKWST